MEVTVLVEPLEEPITLAEAKQYLKVDFSEDDQLITMLIKAVREQCELFTGLSFITQTRQAYLTNCSSTEIPYGPIQSITSVNQINYDNTETELTADQYFTEGLGYITISTGRTWRLSQGRLDTKVRVVYDAGYGDASMVPSSIKLAILKEVAELYENRENSLIGSIVADLSTTTKTLLQSFKRNVLI